MEMVAVQSGARRWATLIPWLLMAGRGVAAPCVLALALVFGAWEVASATVLLAFLSDWWDGVLARRWGTATEALRRADSRADVMFYMAVMICLLVWRSEILAPFAGPLIGLVLCEVACQAANYWRFGCGTATHAWACKIWAILLCFTTIGVISPWMAYDSAAALLQLCLIWGYIAYFEVFLIIGLLPQPAIDVPTSLHAWRLRQALLSGTATPPNRRGAL
jgi:CDP-diacylglycerol--glycerol-3-phosphate 3-phosphatidyltransferase